MPDYLSLEEAAKKLGIPTERLVDLRSQGEVRGFRDGASWKFPETEIARLADELLDSGAGSGFLVDSDLGSIGKSSGNIIGGDKSLDLGSGSDLEIGDEALLGGSDVNLVADATGDSGIALVASDSSSGLEKKNKVAQPTKPVRAEENDDDLLIDDSEELAEIDSKELRIEEPAILHDSDEEIDLGLDLKDAQTGGSTGPTVDAIKQGSSVSSLAMDGSSGSLNIGAEPEDELALTPESDLSFTGTIPDEDSDDVVLGAEDSDMDAMASGILGSDVLGSDVLGSDVLGSDVLGSDVLQDSSVGSVVGSEASSLELMGDLDMPTVGGSMHGSSGADVLSELDLLSADGDSGGSGLISGDSENLLVSSGGLGSSLGEDVLSGIDDALADDDDLVIADDDDDLVIDSSGTDISVAGDSGINLMSPSDSGLSLESEPLDLAGSSISALDLGAELSEGSDPSGSAVEAGIAGDSSGSMVDFQADEEFQLSPSGIGLEADLDSGSQVIEVEDSEAIGEAVEFADAGLEADPFAADQGGFAAEPAAVATGAAGLVAEADVVQEESPGALETTAARRPSGVPAVPPSYGGYEVQFGIFQCLSLLCILGVMTLCGMLMTDLVRNMWTYTEGTAPVSSITDSLLEMIGW